MGSGASVTQANKDENGSIRSQSVYYSEQELLIKPTKIENNVVRSYQKTQNFKISGPRFSVAVTGSESVKIVIIGAGIAGLTCARILADKGFDVTVLEGRSRLGGRIHTDRTSFGVPIDLGAGWIHQAEGNPISSLARKYGVEMVTSNYDNCKLYDGDGKDIDNQATSIDKRYNKIMEKVKKLQETSETDMSLSAAFDVVASEMRLTRQDLLNLQYSASVFLEHKYAGSVDQLSLLWFDEGEEFDGEDQYMVGGYDGIIHGLSKDLKVLLDHPVTGIFYEGVTAVVEVASSASFECDYVVSTLPLGVLKREAVHFSPPLPMSKLNAICSLGVGVINKLALKFSKKFWNDVEVINHISKSPGRWARSYNIHFYTDEPVLVMCNAADFGMTMEVLKDEDIIAEAMTVLRSIYEDDEERGDDEDEPQVPDPVNFLITRWSSDPFSYGSHSFSAVKTVQSLENTDRLALAAPLENRLFFAGEATSLVYPATVHGAYVSGLDTATQIISLHCSKGS